MSDILAMVEGMVIGGLFVGMLGLVMMVWMSKDTRP